jgi:hypothetical protein
VKKTKCNEVMDMNLVYVRIEKQLLEMGKSGF